MQRGKLPYQKSAIYMEMNGMLLGPQSLDYSAVWQVTLPEVSYLHGNECNVVRTTKSGLQCSVASYLTRSLLSTWK